jgi:hypothetical protein
MLGGRVAEELVFNEITSGASNDIERATLSPENGLRMGHEQKRSVPWLLVKKMVKCSLAVISAT